MWIDDFDGRAGTPPSPRHWSKELGGGWGDEQLQVYTDAPANAALDGDGNLAIVGSWPGNAFDERSLPATVLVDWVRWTSCGNAADAIAEP